MELRPSFLPFLVVFFSLSSVTILTSGDDPAPKPPVRRKFPSFPDLSQFRHLHVKSSSRTLDGKVRFFDEWYNFESGRGLLDIDSFNPKESSLILYFNDTRQTLSYEKFGPFADCKVQDLKMSRTNTFVDYVHLDLENERQLMVGPLAVWRRVTKIAKRMEELDMDDLKGSPDHNVRGVKAYRFWLNYANDDILGQVSVAIYFMNDTWNKYEDTRMPLPLKIELSGMVGGKIMNDEIEFFDFEETDSIDLNPIVGIGCQKVKSDGTPFKGSDILLEYPMAGMTIETVDEPTSPSGPKTVAHHQLFLDSISRLARFTGMIQTSSKTFINDLRRGVSYVYEDGQSCSINNMHDLKFESRAVSKSLPQLLFMDGSTVAYHLGQTRRRNIQVDVFEQVFEKHQFDLFDDDRQRGKYDKAVVTHFISSNIDLESLSKVPVATLLTGYAKGENDDLKMTFQQEVNYYDFRSLTYDESSLEVFDVTDCFAPNDRVYFDLFINYFDAGYFVNEKPHLVEAEVVKQLVKLLNISSLRIAKVDLSMPEFESGGSDEEGKKMTINVVILEKPKAKYSFRTVISDMAKPKEQDKKSKVNEEEDCAISALKDNNVRGYYYCKGTCFTSTRDPGSPDGGGKDADLPDGLTCDYNERSILPSKDSIDNIGSEGTLKEIQLALMTLSSSHALSFIVTDGKFTETYLVDNVAVSQDPEKFLERSHYKQSSTGMTLTKTVNTEEENAVSSLGDCQVACDNKVSMNCESLAFCRKGEEVSCILSSELAGSPFIQKTKDAGCDIYSKTYLSRFLFMNGSLSGVAGEVEVAESTEEDCARRCTNAKGTDSDLKADCLSFAMCGIGKCLLYKEHAAIHGEKGKKHEKDGKECTLYSVRHLFEYQSMSDVIVESDPLEELEGESADACASRCSATTDCQSFNFCPASAKSTRTSCKLFKTSPSDSKAKTATGTDGCKNYHKSDPTSTSGGSNSPTNSTNGISGGAFAGVLIAMIVVGLLLGVAGDVAWKKYQERRGNGEGLLIPSVRWTRQRDEE